MRALALLYHDVIEAGRPESSGFPGSTAALYKLERDAFACHLDEISANGPIRSASALDLLPESPSPEEPFLLMTFDDGGAGAMQAAGLLEERGWRGHFLVPTDYIGQASFLGRADIRDLWQRGHVIGSHSCSHPLRMAACPEEQLLDEWARSTSVLGEIVGQAVPVASIPGGYYSPAVARAAAAAGVKALFTSEPVTRSWRVDGCLVLGRYTVKRGDPAARVAALVSGSLRHRLVPFLHWTAKKAVKRVGGEAYTKLRRSLLQRSRAR